MKQNIVPGLIILVLLLVTGCRKGPEANKGGTVSTADSKQNAELHPRLVTFSPAITALVFGMGLGDYVVGVTNYCDLPSGVNLPRVGGALNVRTEPILAVRPEIILTQSTTDKMELLRKIEPQVRVEYLTIETLANVGQAMIKIGELVGQPQLGQEYAARYQAKLDTLRAQTAGLVKKKVLFVMGYQNPSGPGAGTFLDEMITLAGGENILTASNKGWVTLSVETVIAARPEVIICQCDEAEKDAARQYWQELAQSDWPRQVYTVTDKKWTIPAGHLAEYAEITAEMIQPDTIKPLVKP